VFSIVQQEWGLDFHRLYEAVLRSSRLLLEIKIIELQACIYTIPKWSLQLDILSPMALLTAVALGVVPQMAPSTLQ
jgi:hypothetical protein